MPGVSLFVYPRALSFVLVNHWTAQTDQMVA